MNSELERFAIQDLRAWGCKCKEPLLGWRPEWGPRCRLCNTENPNKAWKAEAMEVLRFYADPFGYVMQHNIDEETPDFYDELDTGWRARRLVAQEDGR